MKYKNATQILPKELMDEVQKYIQGEYLYIPKAEGTKKKWGDNSGYRRNLSENTIKKIVYVKINPVTDEIE